MRIISRLISSINVPPCFLSPATKIVLKDDNFALGFKIVAGSPNAEWESLEAGESFVHAVIIVPEFQGEYNFTQASYTYTSDGAEQVSVSAARLHITCTASAAGKLVAQNRSPSYLTAL